MPPSETLIERTLSNLADAWRDIAQSAARTVGRNGGKWDAVRASAEPEALKAFMTECLEARGGEVSARARAADLGRVYLTLDDTGRARFLGMLAGEFAADHAAVDAAIAVVQAAGGEAARQHAEADLRRALLPPWQRLLTGFNALPEGVKFLVDLRADIIRLGKGDAALGRLETDLKDLLASWFDIGFLDLKRITWDAPAALLEKLIAYEAVHEIRSWSDLKNRLASDRRCFAFFHPSMPDEPLVFVEVALTRAVPGSIQAVLAPERERVAPGEATTAVFYSISNSQEGLKGVSFGAFLIKQVAEDLAHALPKLETFVTLSPVPGLARWLAAEAARDPDLPAARAMALIEADGWRADPKREAELKVLLLPLAASYCLDARRGDGQPTGPVARFHLGNGASLLDIHWMGDTSEKGLAQSFGIMVNYHYDLDKIEENHEAYATTGKVTASRKVRNLAATARKG